MQFEFVPATKAGSKARIALVGGPGSGKTYTALTIAQGLGAGAPTVAVIDTERKSSLKYADEFDFHFIGMSSFDPEHLTLATLAAGRQGFEVLIVDTASPFWAGENGMLDRVGGFTSSFEGWRNMRPVERAMLNALLGYPGHVIVNLRTKTEYVVERNDNGKMEPRRLGLKPEQRDGIEYEFDVVCDVADAGTSMRVSKTRCPELANKVFSKPGAAVGETIQAWLNRDAVGEPLNPRTVRTWALDPDRTIEELRDKHAELETAGQLEAIVYDLHEDEDKPTTIGQLLMDRAGQIRQSLQRTARAARPESEAR